MADNPASAQVVAAPEAAPEVLGAARSFFHDRGFAVSEPFAGSFSISGPASLFEATFGVPLRRETRDGLERLCVEGPSGPSDQLPRQQLPREWADAVQVVFSPPPAFGPTSY
jgi:hypothetical protein